MPFCMHYMLWRKSHFGRNDGKRPFENVNFNLIWHVAVFQSLVGLQKNNLVYTFTIRMLVNRIPDFGGKGCAYISAYANTHVSTHMLRDLILRLSIKIYTFHSGQLLLLSHNITLQIISSTKLRSLSCWEQTSLRVIFFFSSVKLKGFLYFKNAGTVEKNV